MARGRKEKQVDGQMCMSGFCTDASNYVVQADTLIRGRQALKLNSAKLIRAAITQVVREDEELQPYVITIKGLAELLQVDGSNLYKFADEITDDIIKHPVYIREEGAGTAVKWIKIPWVSRCEYNSDMGIALKLNEGLKPFLINLKGHYTQYPLHEILVMKSVYAIRVFEMLQSKITDTVLPKEGVSVRISVQEIRECCGCEDKYAEFKNLRAKVLDKAKEEINRVTVFRVSYSYIKQKRSVIAIEFHVNMFFNVNPHQTDRL